MTRFLFLDFLKVVAFNLIVFHHLAFYGPMADQVRHALPDLIDWLAGPARIAVQIFLVVGGFLAAKSLASRGQARLFWLWQELTRRFVKLVPPFMVAMLLAVAASRCAAIWIDHYSLTPSPTWAQIAAHALLLHGVLGVESLSAGAWYVAIDFQLYALLVLLFSLARGFRNNDASRWRVPLLIAVGIAASLFYFNPDPQWDNWAPYFFGSYGLGALAWLASRGMRSSTGSALLIGIMILLGGLALEFDFRSRIALALAVSLALAMVYGGAQAAVRWEVPGLHYLARISYSVFLIHFPVCVLVNTLFTCIGSSSPLVQGIGMLVAWVASIAAGALFHRWVEIPLGRLIALPKLPKPVRAEAGPIPPLRP
ncbi:acyltransferase family protein [Noviherbaspirillum saxi]|nr:acyltransferase [Noviherbaspirillum saxi]